MSSPKVQAISYQDIRADFGGGGHYVEREGAGLRGGLATLDKNRDGQVTQKESGLAASQYQKLSKKVTEFKKRFLQENAICNRREYEGRLGGGIGVSCESVTLHREKMAIFKLAQVKCPANHDANDPEKTYHCNDVGKTPDGLDYANMYDQGNSSSEKNIFTVATRVKEALARHDHDRNGLITRKESGRRYKTLAKLVDRFQNKFGEIYVKYQAKEKAADKAGTREPPPPRDKSLETLAKKILRAAK